MIACGLDERMVQTFESTMFMSGRGRSIDTEMKYVNYWMTYVMTFISVHLYKQ
jgi:hypothetical protein